MNKISVIGHISLSKISASSRQAHQYWLLWYASQLESFIGNPPQKIAGILGVNKAGDLQYIVMPTIVPSAIGIASVVIGNSMDASSVPAFVYLNMFDLGYTSVIETHTYSLQYLSRRAAPGQIPQRH